MQLHRRFLFLTFILVFVFSACQAADPADEKMIFVTAGDHFQLGVVISDLDKEKKNETGAEKGAYIVDVIEDTEAEKIGLKKGDVITKFGSDNIEDADDLHDLISEIDEEKEIQLTVVRDKKDMTFRAKLRKVDKEKKFQVHIDDEDLLFDIGEFPSSGEHFDFFITGDNNKGGFLGVNAKNISESMLEYFEVKHGVLVEEVIKDAPAEKAGLKAGDIITKINDRDIKDYSDLIRNLNFYNPGEKVTVYYSRKGTEKNVTVTLAEKKKRDLHKKKILKKGIGPVKWHDKDGNIKIEKRIHTLPDHKMNIIGPRMRFLVI